jgi:hypothetical protein
LESGLDNGNDHQGDQEPEGDTGVTEQEQDLAEEATSDPEQDQSLEGASTATATAP